MDVSTPPDGFEGSECESCLGYPGLDVFISTSCLADCASKVGESVNVFDLLFTQADCFCLPCVGSHCLCFLGVDLQAGVPCVDAEALRLLLYVLKGVGQQADVICETQVFKLVHECPMDPAQWVHGCSHHPVNYKGEDEWRQQTSLTDSGVDCEGLWYGCVVDEVASGVLIQFLNDLDHLQWNAVVSKVNEVDGDCQSRDYSMMICSMAIWSTHDLPARNPACSSLNFSSTAAQILSKMILVKILLGRDSSCIPLQFLHSLRSPFLGSLMI